MSFLPLADQVSHADIIIVRDVLMDCLPSLLLHDPFDTINPTPPAAGESLFEGCEESDVRQALVEMVMGRHVPPPTIATTATSSSSNFIKCSSMAGEDISLGSLSHQQLNVVPQDLFQVPATVTETCRGPRSYSSLIDSVDTMPPPTSRRPFSEIVSQTSNHDGLHIGLSVTTCSLSETGHQQQQQQQHQMTGEGFLEALIMPSDITVEYPLPSDQQHLTFDPSNCKASKSTMSKMMTRVSDEMR